MAGLVVLWASVAIYINYSQQQQRVASVAPVEGVEHGADNPAPVTARVTPIVTAPPIAQAWAIPNDLALHPEKAISYQIPVAAGGGGDGPPQLQCELTDYCGAHLTEMPNAEML